MSLSKPAASTAKAAAPKKAGAAAKSGSKLAQSLQEAGAAGSFSGLSDEALQARTAWLKERLVAGETLDVEGI